MTFCVHSRIEQTTKAGIEKNYPALKPYQIDRIIDKYTDAVLIIIKQHLSLGGSLDGTIQFSLTEARTDAGRFRYKGEEKWIFNEVDPLARIFTYREIGANRHNSLTKAKLQESNLKLFSAFFGLDS